MILLTDEIKKELPPLYSSEETPCERKTFHVRFFNPLGNQSWKIAEGSEQPDGDWLLFGFCDLDMGSPEWGYVLLSELESVSAGLGLGIERDICFGASRLHPEWGTVYA